MSGLYRNGIKHTTFQNIDITNYDTVMIALRKIEDYGMEKALYCSMSNENKVKADLFRESREARRNLAMRITKGINK